MTGLNKIVEKIDEKSLKACNNIIKNADLQAEEIINNAKKQGEEEATKILNDADNTAKEIIAMAKSGAEQKSKQALLKAKIDSINDTLDEVCKSINNMEPDKYFNIIAALVKENADDGKGIMTLSEKDIKRLPPNFEKTLNVMLDKGKTVTISKEPGNFENGFILAYGDIEENCTFEAILSSQRDKLKEKIYSLIFS